MARPMETQMTISCLQCEWSVEAVNTSVQESSAFLEAAYTHADQHEQHALEIVQRLRVYSENYVGPPTPAPDTSGLSTVCRHQARYWHPDRLHGQVQPRALNTMV